MKLEFSIGMLKEIKKKIMEVILECPVFDDLWKRR